MKNSLVGPLPGTVFRIGLFGARGRCDLRRRSSALGAVPGPGPGHPRQAHHGPRAAICRTGRTVGPASRRGQATDSGRHRVIAPSRLDHRPRRERASVTGDAVSNPLTDWVDHRSRPSGGHVAVQESRHRSELPVTALHHMRWAASRAGAQARATARTVTASSSPPGAARNPFLRKGFRGQATDSGRHHGIASSPRGRATELTLAPAQRANSASGVTRQLARSIGPRMRFRSASSSRCRSRSRSRRRRPIAIHMASRPCASSRRSSRRNSRRR